MNRRRCGGCTFFSADQNQVDRVWKGPCIMKGIRVTDETEACDTWLRKGSPPHVIADAWHRNYGDK